MGLRTPKVAHTEIESAALTILVLGAVIALFLGSTGFPHVDGEAPAQRTPRAAPTATADPLEAATLQLTPATLPGWHLIFDDEFDGTALNTKLWRPVDSAVPASASCCTGWGDQAWSPRNLSEANGSLNIQTTAQARGGYPYTSGGVTTQGLFRFEYGRIDVRAKLPNTAGLWPAFWLLNFRNAAGYYAPYYEIDFLEGWMGDPTHVFAYFHMDQYQASCEATGAPFPNQFHVYTLIWSPGKLTWEIDGKAQCTDTTFVPNMPMYLLFDTAIGGAVQSTNSSTQLPQTTSIDYVRVWQPTPEAGRQVRACSACTAVAGVSPRSFDSWDGAPCCALHRGENPAHRDVTASAEVRDEQRLHLLLEQPARTADASH